MWNIVYLQMKKILRLKSQQIDKTTGVYRKTRKRDILPDRPYHQHKICIEVGGKHRYIMKW